jgi:cell division protein FtsQ
MTRPGPDDGPGVTTPPHPADAPGGGDGSSRRPPAPPGPGPGAGRARGRARGRSPWRTAFFALAGVGLLVGVGWALLGSKLLVVRSVVVTGTHLVPAAQVRAAAAIPSGQPLIRVDTAAAARRVEAITQVQSAQVSKSWPDRIVITVRERTPALAVAVPAAGGASSSSGTVAGYDLIDASGVVVRSATAKPAGLPVYWPAAGSGALRGSPSVAAVVTVLHELPAPIAWLVSVVSASSPQNVTLGLSDGITIVWGDTTRAAEKATELAALMRTHMDYYDVSAPGTAVTR